MGVLLAETATSTLLIRINSRESISGEELYHAYVMYRQRLTYLTAAVQSTVEFEASSYRYYISGLRCVVHCRNTHSVQSIHADVQALCVTNCTVGYGFCC